MILKNTVIYTMGNVVPKVIGFLLIPLYSHILTPDEYGIIGGLAGLTSILAVVMTLALDRSIFRLYWEHKTPDARRRYLGTISVALTVVAASSTLLLIFPLRPIVARAFPDIPFFPYYGYCIVTAAVHTAGLVPRCHLQINKKAGPYVLLTATEAVLNTSMIALFVAVLRRGATGYFEALFLVSLLYLPVYVWMTARIARRCFDWRVFVASARFSMPMIPSLISVWLTHSANRMILVRYASQADLGVFSMANQLAGIVKILSQAFLMSYTPIFYELATRDGTGAIPVLRKYNNAFLQSLGVLACFAATATFVAFDWIFDARYAYARTLLPLMVVTVWVDLAGGITTPCVYQHKRSDIIMRIQLVLVVVNVALNFLLMPSFGAAGAVYAGLATAAVSTAISYNVSRRFFFVPHDRLTWIVGAVLVLCGGLPFLTDNRPVQIAISSVALVGLLIATYRSLQFMRRRPHRKSAVANVGGAQTDDPTQLVT